MKGNLVSAAPQAAAEKKRQSKGDKWEKSRQGEMFFGKYQKMWTDREWSLKIRDKKKS